MKQVSRADLLRALVAQERYGTRFTGLPDALGFSPLATADESPPVPSLRHERGAVAPAQQDDTQVIYGALVEQNYWFVAAFQEEAPGDAENRWAWPALTEESPLCPRECQETEQPLRSGGQWQNLWDQALPQPCRSQWIDVKRSIRQIAQAKPISSLPRLAHRSFNRKVTLLWDYSEDNYPAWPDMRAARRSLNALLGRVALCTLYLPAGPLGEIKCSESGEVLTPKSIDKQSLILLIGSFGALRSGRASPAWRHLFKQLARQGRGLLLLPLCPMRPCGVDMLEVDPAYRHGTTSYRASLDTLMTLLSQSWRTSRARLRQLRRLIPKAGLYSELLAYNQAQQVRKVNDQIQLREAELCERLNAYRQLPSVLQEQVDRLVEAWQPKLNSLERECLHLQRQMLNDPCAAVFPSLAYLGRQVQQHADAGKPWPLAFQNINAALPLINALVACNAKDPNWQPLFQIGATVARQLGKPQPLRQRGLPVTSATQHLCARDRGLVLLTEEATAGRTLLMLSENAYCEQTRTTLRPGELLLATPLDIVDNGHRYQLKALPRPAWAERIWQDADGLHAAHTDGGIFRRQPAGPERPVASWVCVHQALPWANEQGVDDYGLWAACDIDGDTRFRLRWISPGRFLMGSPENEVDRADDETQHEVRLSQGYWLGETAVNQAVWHALMGKNPTHFRGDNLPVEQVSWLDCQEFVKEMGQRQPGMQWRLPTEAEWEYACRAGSVAAFSWGDGLHTGQANYHGDHPYADGKKGGFRSETLPVTSFQPNHWGLYQMHGNVWEWCEDRYGSYPAHSVEDPTGPVTGRGRVLRGGCWNGSGRFLRSAQRRALTPDARSHGRGLRLAGGADPQAGREAMSADRWPQGGQQGGGHVPNRDQSPGVKK